MEGISLYQKFWLPLLCNSRITMELERFQLFYLSGNPQSVLELLAFYPGVFKKKIWPMWLSFLFFPQTHPMYFSHCIITQSTKSLKQKEM